MILAQTSQPQTQPAAGAEDLWYAQTFLNNAVWQWAALLGILIATFILGRILSFILDRQGRRLVEARRLVALGTFLRNLSGPTALLIFGGGLLIGGQVLNLRFAEGQDLTWFWMAVCQTIAVLAVGWGIFRLVDVVEMFLLRWTSRTRTQLDDQLVPILRKSLRVFVVIVVALFIAQNVFEWNIASLLAGLGLGGLAFALAAQDMIKNLFGSVTIFADRPFQLGDWVKIQGFNGFVEEVGFRSTRIRTLDGTLATIPNAAVADSPIENIGRRPSIKRVLNVTVTYDTPPEKVSRGVEILREMLEARRDRFPADRPGRVYFSDFNSASLNLVVYYWYQPPDWWEYMDFTHEFNLELLRRFNAEGIEFAFPTQTLYVKQDPPLSADVRLVGNDSAGPQGE